MDVVVKQSGIHGRGVYALRAFRIGEIVLAWDTSKRVSARNAASMSGSDSFYLHPYDPATWFVVQSPECFVNHSCGNNTEARGFADVAVRNIATSEEITSNYETDGAGLSFVCHCGSPGCRGIIEATVVGIPSDSIAPR